MRLVSMCCAAFLTAAACGGGGGDSATGPKSSGAASSNGDPANTTATTVTVNNNYYTPAEKTVAAGTTVQWTWSSCSGGTYGDETCISHTVSFDDGPTSDMQSQGSYSRRFTSAGVYRYHCQNHGTAMSGTITVQ